MKVIFKLLELRPLSWLFFVAAVGIPVYLYASQLQIERRQVPENGGVACGMGMFAAIMLGALAAILFSVVAFGLSALAYRRQVKPRSRVGLAEMCLLGLPAMLGGSMFAYMMLAG